MKNAAPMLGIFCSNIPPKRKSLLFEGIIESSDGVINAAVIQDLVSNYVSLSCCCKSP